VTCGSAEDALNAVLDRGNAVGVMLLDVNLAGGMTACQLLTALTEQGAPVRVVLTSGLAREDVSDEMLDHPLVAGYLAKPYDIDALLAAVRAAGAGVYD
jgi:DNA-binding NarL/FixJ family response regulator